MFARFNDNKYYIPIEGNKVVDIRDLSVCDRTNKHMFMEQINTIYDVNCNIEPIRDILNKMVGENNFEFFKQLLGFLICPNNNRKFSLIVDGHVQTLKELLHKSFNVAYSHVTIPMYSNINVMDLAQGKDHKRLMSFTVCEPSVSHSMLNKLIYNKYLNVNSIIYRDNIQEICSDSDMYVYSFTLNQIDLGIYKENSYNFPSMFLMFCIISANESYVNNIHVPKK